MSEYRNDEREAPMLLGRVAGEGNRPGVLCPVLDLSHSGARLLVTEEAALPDEFDLFLPTLPEAIRSSVCWRSGDEIGVSFVLPSSC